MTKKELEFKVKTIAYGEALLKYEYVRTLCEMSNWDNKLLENDLDVVSKQLERARNMAETAYQHHAKRAARYCLAPT